MVVTVPEIRPDWISDDIGVVAPEVGVHRGEKVREWHVTDRRVEEDDAKIERRYRVQDIRADPLLNDPALGPVCCRRSPAAESHLEPVRPPATGRVVDDMGRGEDPTPVDQRPRADRG